MKDLIDNTLIFIAMLLLQVLIFNHIIIFHVAVPLVFIYFIIRQRIDFNTNLLLLLAFVMGGIVDIFSDTAGVNTLACTALAMLKRPVMYAYVSRDDKTMHIMPSAYTMGAIDYSKFLLTMTGIYTFMVFVLDYASFADVWQIVICTIGSTLLSFPIMLGFDAILGSRRSTAY